MTEASALTYMTLLTAIAVLVYRDELGLVQGRETEDLVAIAAFSFLSGAYLLGQGLADWGKSAAVVHRDAATVVRTEIRDDAR